MNRKIIVLLAACNGSRWLTKQVESILHQFNVNCNIYISVDQSEDGTEYFCKELAKEDSRITVLSNNNKFGGAAANFFHLISNVDFLDSDYISFSDQDDIWFFDKLSRAIEANCDGYSSNVTAFWPDGRQILINKAQLQVEWDYLFESAGPGCTFVLTKKLALELQEFVRKNKEKLSAIWMHDWFIYAFARSRGYKWYIDERPSMLYRQHSNNQVGVNLGYKAFRQRWHLIRTGKWLKQSSLIASLCELDSHDFIKKWHDHSRLGMLYLAINATKCRRKRSEQFFLALSCIVFFFVGHRKT